MASQRTKFNVGLFLSCGIAMALVAVIWLGMSHFFEKTHTYVTYFNESVQGLDVDSPVKYRGVAIGRVGSIAVAPDSKLIEVTLVIESGQKLSSDTVAQLKAVGITGSMFVELDRRKPGDPEGFVPSVSSFPFKYEVVPSRASNISELLRGIDEVLNHIKMLDLKGISDKMKYTLDHVNRVMADADVAGLSSKAHSTLEGVDRILDRRRWSAILDSVDDATRSLNRLMAKAGKVMDTADQTLGHVRRIVKDEQETIETTLQDFGEAVKNTNRFLRQAIVLAGRMDDSRAHLIRHLLVAAQNLEKTTENLNRLLENVSDQPSRLLFGEPPPPRKLPPAGNKTD